MTVTDKQLQNPMHPEAAAFTKVLLGRVSAAMRQATAGHDVSAELNAIMLESCRLHDNLGGQVRARIDGVRTRAAAIATKPKIAAPDTTLADWMGGRGTYVRKPLDVVVAALGQVDAEGLAQLTVALDAVLCGRAPAQYRNPADVERIACLERELAAIRNSGGGLE